MILHIATSVFYSKIKHIFIIKNIIDSSCETGYFMRLAMLISANNRAT